MRAVRRALFISSLVSILWVGSALACDMTCIYSQPDEDGDPSEQRLSVALFMQNSDIDSLQLDGSTIDNPMGEFIDSTVTQTVLSYRVAPRWSMQLNLPYIDRSYERMVDGAMEAGNEAGIGDAMLMARYIGRERYIGMTRLNWSGGLGLELPTGDSDRLGEHHDHSAHGSGHGTGHSMASIEDPHGEPGHGRGAESAVVGSGIHGHELALGNGALDYIASASVGLSRGRGSWQTLLQHTLRQEGDFDYRLADDTQMAMNARFAVRGGARGTLSMGVGLLGQDKGTDTVAGDLVAGTQMRSIFAGPVLSYSAASASRLRASLAVDLPVYQDNSDLALVVDRRVRFSATARF